ncbi:protein kintoun [Centropristis striata]|uniref:protein kintoun n=1 Tax=Centropristis striata TaxID=184440 RepID=UPI0027E1D886|nr:protein kintoun [Centropristis striata]
MEVGDQLKELNMTTDEMERLTKALKDEKFREMLRDYAHELSDPENKKRYEEEIKLLEQERGNTIDFIHPEPFRALRTSVNGKQKCFINICANDRVGKPECKWGVSADGRRGQSWSLPHSLHPGRQDTDPKGNKIMIYDAVFHPDTIHIASKNKRFMEMVDSTAIQGIQDAFKVTLDKNNVRELKTKYKGTPQPCVIRKPIPGYKKEPSEEPDPLAFPYPCEKRPPTSLQAEPAATKNSRDAEQKSFQIQPQRAKEPTKPNYTVKYRSFVDLQDFRCSRDSAQSPRPKEIVVTIDMPLLKAATDASLEVEERRLLLEAKKPAYRLELPLAYPVDEDKGEAMFNKQRGQLTVTLSVLPSNEAVDFAVGSAQTSDDERQEEVSEVEEEDEWIEKREDKESKEEEQGGVEQDLRVEEGEEEGGRGQKSGEEQMKEGENSDEGNGVEVETKWKEEKGKGQDVEEEKVNELKHELEKEIWDCNSDNKDPSVTSLKCNTVTNVSSGEENRLQASPETESQPVLITAEHSSCTGKEEEVIMKLTTKMKTSGVKEDTGKTRECVSGNEKVETDAASLHHGSTEESTAAHRQNVKESSTSQEPSKTPATDETNKSSRGGSASEEPAVGSLKQEARGDVDEDDLPTEQIFQSPVNDKQPPVVLREIDEDGNETIISDHVTCAGFIFQNSLIYELD